MDWAYGALTFYAAAVGTLALVGRHALVLVRFLARAEPGWRKRAGDTLLLAILVLAVLPHTRRSQPSNGVDLERFQPYRPA